MTKRKKPKDAIRVVTEETPFIQALVSLKVDFLMIKELNQQLSHLIKQAKEKELIKFLKKSIENKDFKKEIDEVTDFVERIDKEIKGKKLKHVYLGFDKTSEVIWEIAKLSQPKNFIVFIRNMSLIYLVAAFESLLRKILEYAFQKKPEILMTCQKSVTYEDLLKFGDINDAKHLIIEKETRIVNEDPEEIKKYFKQRFSIDISNFVDWKEFKERFYRRNIIIHNSGFPNELYRLKTGYKGKSKHLCVSKSYLSTSIRLLDAMGINICKHFNKKFK